MIYAGMKKRFWAGFIDFLVLLPLLAICYWLSFFSKTLALWTQLPSSLLFAFYAIYFHAQSGQTIGKRVAKIRVVPVDGSRIGYSHALRRSSVDCVLSIASAVAIIVTLKAIPDALYSSASWMKQWEYLAQYAPAWSSSLDLCIGLWYLGETVCVLFDKQKRAIHDFLAGTVVINESPR